MTKSTPPERVIVRWEVQDRRSGGAIISGSASSEAAAKASATKSIENEVPFLNPDNLLIVIMKRIAE